LIGKYNIIVDAKKRYYEFDVKRKFTIITGDSATGKSILFKDITNGHFTKIYVTKYNSKNKLEYTDTKLIPFLNIERFDGNTPFSQYKNQIIIIDEHVVKLTKDFIKLMRESDNYFILITRNKLGYLNYAIEEIFCLTCDTKNITQLMYKFDTMYKLHNIHIISNTSDNLIITEDSQSGLQLFSKLFNNCNVISANGRGNICNLLYKVNINNYKNIFIIVDGAAFGSDMQSLSTILFNNSNIHLIAPESFEYLLLKSIYRNVERTDYNEYIPIELCLSKPYDMIDDKYGDGSWEIYFEKLIKLYTQNTEFEYSKHNLKSIYYKYTEFILNTLYNSNIIIEKETNLMDSIDDIKGILN